MKIELLDDKTVKVLLSKHDMHDLNLTYEELDYKNPSTKKILVQLLDEVKKQLKLDISKGKLFIEAFPYADGGCMLYVNMLDTIVSAAQVGQKKKATINTPIIGVLENANDLYNLSSMLLDKYSHIILKSSLYLMNEKYHLVLYTYCKMDNEISGIINEYGKLFGKGAVSASIIFEHGTPIATENALELLVTGLN